MSNLSHTAGNDLNEMILRLEHQLGKGIVSNEKDRERKEKRLENLKKKRKKRQNGRH